MGKARRPQRANRPGAKRLRVRVKPHATRPRTQLPWRNLALVAGVCLVMLCLAQPTQCSRRRLPKGGKRKKVSRDKTAGQVEKIEAGTTSSPKKRRRSSVTGADVQGLVATEELRNAAPETRRSRGK